jgi:hypothetical protein
MSKGEVFSDVLRRIDDGEMCQLRVVTDDEIDQLMEPREQERFDVVLVRDGWAERFAGRGVDIDEAVGHIEGFNSAMRDTGLAMVIAEHGTVSIPPPSAYRAVRQFPSTL